MARRGSTSLRSIEATRMALARGPLSPPTITQWNGRATREILNLPEGPHEWHLARHSW
jgi:hypothetical protein